MPSAPTQRRRPPARSSPADEAEPASPRQRASEHVVAHRRTGDEARCLRSSGTGDAARRARRAGAPDPQRPAVDADLAALPPVASAEERSSSSVRPAPTRPAMPTISPACSVEARRRRSAPRRHEAATSSRGSPRRTAGAGTRRPSSRPTIMRISARGVDPGGRRASPTRRPVAQHRDPVGTGEHLVAACARCRRSPTPRPARRAHESNSRSTSRRDSADVGSSMIRSADVLDERLGDLDQLPLGHAERADRRAGIEPRTPSRRPERARPAARMRRRSTSPRRAAARGREDVLGDR